MSKSILIVICDFLLISLLSLANFDKPSSLAQQQEEEQKQEERNFVDSQMVDLLKMSLDNERLRRENLDGDMEKLAAEARQSRELSERQMRELAEREKQLQELAALKEKTESEYALARETSEALAQKAAESEKRNTVLQTEIIAATAKMEEAAKERLELEKRLGDIRESDVATRTKLEAAQAELLAHKQQLEKLKAESDSLKNENRAMEIEKQALATRLEVASTKTQIYEENLKQAQALVDIEKLEKEKIREHAETLAVGVSELASSQKEISKDVRELRPKTSSEIFDSIKNSFVRVRFDYSRKGILGVSDSSAEIRAVPLDIGGATWLVFSTRNTPLQPTLNAYYAPETLSVTVTGKAFKFSPVQIYSVKEDPRLLAVQVPPQFVERESISPMQVAQNFFAFPDCVVINSEKSYYGEIPYRADFKDSNYAKMDVGLLQSVFGTFSPSEGDISVSRNGDYMGCMLNSDTAVLMRSFNTLKYMPLGEKYSPQGAAAFVRETSAALRALPLALR